MHHINRIIAFSAFLLLASQQGASAQSYFGAFAVAPNGAYGVSWDYPTQNQAINAALRNCRQRAQGCRYALWFRNACGALAMNNRNAWATAWGNSRGRAERTALNRCNNKWGNCYIRHWACTTRPR